MFSPENAGHEAFRPVKGWIESGRGRIVYGGSDYMRELKRVRTVMMTFVELANRRWAVRVRDETVDAHQSEVERKTIGTDCHDQHVIALLAASGCRLLCSHDQRSFDYVKDKSLYPDGEKRRIYTRAKHAKLLAAHCGTTIRNVHE